MTRSDMEKYPALMREIGRQQRRLESLLKRLERGEFSTDIVRGSSKEFPYGERTYRIEGIPVDSIESRKKLIEESIKQADSMALEIERFINTATDPLMREVLRCRYIDCMTIADTAVKNYVSERHMKRLLRDFFAS